jgi:TonB family protein
MSLRLDGRADVDLQFPPQSRRLALSVLATVLLEASLALILFYVGRSALEVIGVLPERALEFVFLPQQNGTGGGGGGGGNQMPDPPRPAEAPGRDLVTVPVTPLESIQATLEPPPVAQLMLPVQTLAAGVQESIGAMQMPSGPFTASRGPGRGRGAGSGVGDGDGPGKGPGAGPGGGPNGGGSGVTDPVPIVRYEPVYTPDAAAHRIEGEVWVECTVTINGLCSDTRVVRSLDSRYGLDDAAVRAARQWRFRPGRRANGEPVPVVVSIAIAFSIR